MYEALYNGRYYRLKKQPTRLSLALSTNVIIDHALTQAWVDSLGAPTMFTVGDSTFSVTTGTMWPGFASVIISAVGVILIALGYIVSIAWVYIAGFCIAAAAIPFGCAWVAIELFRHWRECRRAQMAIAV